MTRFMIFVLGLLLLAPAVFGGEKGKQTPKQAVTAERGLPKEAKEIGPNKYRHTDASGKTWIYTRTPFGWSKATEADLESTDRVSEDDGKYMKVRRDGEMVSFERATPFGKSAWKKKVAELSDEEKALLERSEKGGR